MYAQRLVLGAHPDRGARSPLRSRPLRACLRARGALGYYLDALSSFTSLILKVSDTKLDKQKHKPPGSATEKEVKHSKVFLQVKI